MDEQQLLALKPELDQFLDRFAPLFGVEQNQAHARCFVQGLLRQGERRNSENIAEAMAGCNLFGSNGGQAAIVHVVADDIARTRISLEALLPRESLSKEVDAAVLSITGFPAFAVDDPALVNREPYASGWFFKLKLSNAAELNSLLAPESYKAQIGG